MQAIVFASHPRRPGTGPDSASRSASSGDAAEVFKTNAYSATRQTAAATARPVKALKAKDLRSPEVQKADQRRALIEVISKGKEKMPAFGDKIQPVTSRSCCLCADLGKKDLRKKGSFRKGAQNAGGVDPNRPVQAGRIEQAGSSRPDRRGTLRTLKPESRRHGPGEHPTACVTHRGGTTV